ncbi:hypothetical protein MPL1032_220059 [Mesorhizobium plurifarium]|uniref:Uncharacterized protein n=1 Tax=Mesorhizobium plurifarium TaxID=69974 RepID=A0A0K2VYX9_MESPL|nr:hypothetical protein MPL1032_220059 [Mesorhizobium plurifarium]
MRPVRADGDASVVADVGLAPFFRPGALGSAFGFLDRGVLAFGFGVSASAAGSLGITAVSVSRRFATKFSICGLCKGSASRTKTVESTS